MEMQRPAEVGSYIQRKVLAKAGLLNLLLLLGSSCHALQWRGASFRRRYLSKSLSDFEYLVHGEISKVSLQNEKDLATTTCLKSTASPEYDDLEKMDRPSSKDAKTTGIVGAGAIAFATGALISLSSRSVPSPMLWSPSDRETQIPILKASLPADNLQSGSVSDRYQADFPVRWATSIKELVTTNDVIILALPANGHKVVMDGLAPFLTRKDQTIIISSHSSFGALYLTQQIQHYQQMRGELESDLPTIIAFGTTVCTARRQDPKNSSSADESVSVRVNTIRQAVDLCVLPSSRTKYGVDLCKALFPQVGEFKVRDGLLAISLSNLNPQNHLGIAMGNISRMENQEVWYQSKYITPTIGRLLEALDEERLAIARALDLETKTIYEHFSRSFHVEETDNISEMNRQIHKEGKDVLGPNTVDSRYITEDVPFGLVPTIVLGNLVHCPAPLHQSGVDLISAMYGRDFTAENDLLAALELEAYTISELQQAAQTGILPTKVQKEDTTTTRP